MTVLTFLRLCAGRRMTSVCAKTQNQRGKQRRHSCATHGTRERSGRPIFPWI